MSLRRHIRSLSREQRANLLKIRSLADRSLVARHDVKWLFILTFPNAGSTALAKLILNGRNTIALTPNAEGQWLIPSLSVERDRWDPAMRVDYRKLRAVWLSVLPKRATPLLVVEKSPPNMCRYEKLLETFGQMQTHLITLVRDPYATCASWHQRYGKERIRRAWIPLDPRMTEADYFRLLGRIWLDWARILSKAGKRAILNFRYEDFANDPASVLSALRKRVGGLDDVSPSSLVKVKDHPEQGIVNMNARHIASLTDLQISAISASLWVDKDTVASLGYAIR